MSFNPGDVVRRVSQLFKCRIFLFPGYHLLQTDSCIQAPKAGYYKTPELYMYRVRRSLFLSHASLHAETFFLRAPCELFFSHGALCNVTVSAVTGFVSARLNAWTAYAFLSSSVLFRKLLPQQRLVKQLRFPCIAKDSNAL